MGAGNNPTQQTNPLAKYTHLHAPSHLYQPPRQVVAFYQAYYVHSYGLITS